MVSITSITGNPNKTEKRTSPTISYNRRRQQAVQTMKKNDKVTCGNVSTMTQTDDLLCDEPGCHEKRIKFLRKARKLLVPRCGSAYCQLMHNKKGLEREQHLKACVVQSYAGVNSIDHILGNRNLTEDRKGILFVTTHIQRVLFLTENFSRRALGYFLQAADMIENGISRGEINCPGKKKLTETYNRFIKVEEAYDKIKEHESESRRNLFSECAEFDSIYLLLRNLSFLTGMDIQNIYINYPSIHSVVLHYMKLVSVAEQIIKEDESKELVTNPISSSAKNGQTTQESKKKATRSKASPLRNANSGKLDDLHPAVRIFKRFVALNGKEYNRAKVERILKSLQREIINHTITKDYEYASEVNHLQKKLVDALNLETALGKQTGKIEIETDLLARLQHIIGEAKPADAIALLKSYVRLAGSTNKDKAKRLLKRFDRYNMETPSRALTPHLKSAKNALTDFVEGKSRAIALDEFALHGLDYINYR